ncbi:DPCD family protein [Giardia muris]|uniref:Protein DPCD n=1 Tax=Giardia muris TaxID=5742 RepID=A0A4Z1SQ67_GIAMU|nr:DPCD family protein [Giardia muris]|eukprot:TNJ27984.1 DPCD family protein [Giardia muris]
MSLVPGGKKTAMLKDGVQRIHTVFEGGGECIEEFDAKLQTLLLRKWRTVTKVGRETPWEVEVGEAPVQTEVVTGMFTTKDAPVVTRLDTKESFLFRITNLPGPESNYSATAEEDGIVIRTANKKYYKKLTIRDLTWHKLPYMQQFLRIKHQQNTLLVVYAKPPAILQAEAAAMEQRRSNMKRDGDVQCPTQ